MLAASGRPVGDLREWRIEPKLDGYRAVVGVTPSARIVRTRRGRNITESLPELAKLCDIGVELVLDGELIAGAGRPEDFYGLAGAVASRGRRQRLTFVAFDLLHCQGNDLFHRPLHERRRLLEHVAQLAEGVLHIVPSYPGRDLDDLLGGADELALEGVVLKHQASPYRPGRRTTTWRKLKCPDWAEHRARRFDDHHRRPQAADR
jgi:bifunctional non-homologous end joining protein LigD